MKKLMIAAALLGTLSFFAFSQAIRGDQGRVAGTVNVTNPPITGDGSSGSPLNVDSSSVTLLGSDLSAIGFVQKAGDTMTGQLTLSGSTLTVTGNAFSVGESTFVVKDGKIGIGTNSPAKALSVTGDARVTSDVLGNRFASVADSSENMGFVSNSIRLRTASTDKMTILPGGNIGIGTTNPQEKLHISSGNLVVDYGIKATTAVVNGILTVGTAGGSVNHLVHIATPTAQMNEALHVDGTVHIRSTSSTSGHHALQVQNLAGTTILHVQQDGKIGFAGNENPYYTLDASPSGTIGIGGVYMTNPNPVFYMIDSTSGDDDWRFEAVTDDLAISQLSGGSVWTNRLHIEGDNGNVGISTITPQTKLDVNGNFSWGADATKSTGTATGGLTVVDDLQAGDDASDVFIVKAGTMTVPETATALFLATHTTTGDASGIMRIDGANNRVCFGCRADEYPTVPFMVSAGNGDITPVASTAQFYVENSLAGGTGLVVRSSLYNYEIGLIANSGGGLISSYGTADMSIAVGGTPRITADAAGNVGINDESPEATFEVNQIGSSLSQYALQISSQNSTVMLGVEKTGAVDVSTFTGTYGGGSAYVCVSDAGRLFVSEVACP